MPVSFLLSPEPETFYYPTVPGMLNATRGGTALPIWLIRTPGRAVEVDGEHPANINKTLCDQGRGHLVPSCSSCPWLRTLCPLPTHIPSSKPDPPLGGMEESLRSYLHPTPAHGEGHICDHCAL